MPPIVHQISGVFLILAGMVLGPLPIPLGIPCFALGLALLAPYVPPIRALVRWLRRKYSSFDEQMIKWRDKVPPVVQNTIDRTHP